MSDNNMTSNSLTDIKINTLTIIVASIFIVLTVIFFLLLSFYTKYYWQSRSPRRHTNAVITASAPPAQSRGLDPSILSSIPITMYKPSDLNDGFECAVCLSELAVGEEVRLIPKCSHVFHRECIDTWFRSHSTCPNCRCIVEDYGKQQLDESVGLAANVNERRLMISIPVREDVLSTLECRRKSPVTPKLWPLRRILGKKSGGCSSSSSSSPRIGDIEEGLTTSGAENGEGS